MGTPELLLVPPTPLECDPSIPSSPSTQASSQSSYPTESRFSTIPQRPSSETTIFSIYSMYEDDQAWSASSPPPGGDRKSRDGMISTGDFPLPNKRGGSYMKSNANNELGYYDPDIHEPSFETNTSTFKRSTIPSNGGPNGIVGVPRTVKSTPRPLSHIPPSSLRTSIATSEKHRASTGQTFRTSTTLSFATSPSRSRASSNNLSNHSRDSSRVSVHTDGVDYRHLPLPPAPSSLPPLPPLPHPLPPLPPSVPSSRHSTPISTPPRQPSPALQLPETPKSRSSELRPITDSPSSKISRVPSEGEDVDAFHVRNTYAQLELTGVKGDGYEEGVERTRARVGASRASQLNAEAAIGDGNEKKGELDDREVQTLGSVDRYGFFTVPTHDRLVVLNSGPLRKRLAPVTAVPSSSASATSLRALPPVPPPLKEPSRISKWTRMLRPVTRDHGANVATWGIKPSKEAKLRPRTYKGIPDPWRGAAWEYLMARYSRLGDREMKILVSEYREAIEKPSPYDIQIDLDVPRTISGHVMFRTRYGAGQRSLFHVLHCFSLRCGTCGYVQGMGPIAATLLCYYEPERVYASLVRLHDAYSLHSVFSPGFPGLLEAIYIQERITEQMMPDVYAAFKKHMISTTSYATKWYITLFANSVPFQTQLRLWDAFFLEGYDVFIAVAVAIVWVYRDHITSGSANFETVLSLLSSFFVPEDEDVLLFWISRTLGDKKTRSNMIKWKEDWKSLVAAGKDGSALL